MTDVEIVVAVHAPDRPVERAVGSVLACARAGAIVVVHNTDAARIRERLSAVLPDPRVRLIELHDGVHSPAGPFNAGLDVATAPFVGVLGSDDELPDGALDRLLALQRRHDADVVIARVRDMSSGVFSPTPAVRLPVRTRLDGMRDRLSYRSAPLGIYRRARFPELRFTTGLASGEDIAFVTELWFTPCRRVLDTAGASYLVHADAVSRVTATARSVAADFAFLPELQECMLRLRLTRGQVGAIVVKLIRVNLFGLLVNRPAESWTPAGRAELRDVVRRLVVIQPRALRALSLTDRRLIEAMGDPEVPTDRMYGLLAHRQRRRAPSSILTRSPFSLLRREAPLRFGIASLMRMR